MTTENEKIKNLELVLQEYKKLMFRRNGKQEKFPFDDAIFEHFKYTQDEIRKLNSELNLLNGNKKIYSLNTIHGERKFLYEVYKEINEQFKIRNLYHFIFLKDRKVSGNVVGILGMLKHFNRIIDKDDFNSKLENKLDHNYNLKPSGLYTLNLDETSILTPLNRQKIGRHFV